MEEDYFVFGKESRKYVVYEVDPRETLQSQVDAKTSTDLFISARDCW